MSRRFILNDRVICKVPTNPTGFIESIDMTDGKERYCVRLDQPIITSRLAPSVKVQYLTADRLERIS